MDKMKKLDYFSDAIIDSQCLSDLQGGQGVETSGGTKFSNLGNGATTPVSICDWDPKDGTYLTFYFEDGTQYTGPGRPPE